LRHQGKRVADGVYQTQLFADGDDCSLLIRTRDQRRADGRAQVFAFGQSLCKGFN